MELSNKTMEKKANAARADHDSALQKKENEISTYKNAREKAAEDRDSARSELKAARAEAAQDKKRITQLQQQVTESATNASKFQDQLNRKDVRGGYCLIPCISFSAYVFNYNIARTLEKRTLGAKASGLIKTVGDLETNPVELYQQIDIAISYMPMNLYSQRSIREVFSCISRTSTS